jgi:small subunit ribosomal protein S7
MLMKKGKKSKAENIVYRCFNLLSERTKQQDPIEVFKKAIENARPLLEVKPRRVGGATYQVPVEVKPERGMTIALMWLRNFARLKKGRPMEERLADEIVSAYKGEGSAIKKREETHKMAEANKAFAHYRW